MFIVQATGLILASKTVWELNLVIEAASLENIRLGWKCLALANTYITGFLIVTIKIFIAQTSALPLFHFILKMQKKTFLFNEIWAFYY
jgi:hypothetical protein